MNIRYSFVGILLALLGLCIVGTALYEMTAKASYWETVRDRLATSQTDIPARRGDIYSCDGKLLVGSMPKYTLRMDYVVVDKKNAKAEATTQAWRDSALKADMDSLCMGLAEVFPQKSAEFFRGRLTAGMKTRRHNWKILDNVSYIDYQRVLRLPYVRYGVTRTGFYGEPTLLRQKPYGNMATRTLGTLVSGSDSAKNGLELAYDTILRGTVGKQHKIKVRQQWTVHTDVKPIDGLDLVSTIDVGCQDMAEKLLRQKLTELGAEVGVVVLMEVATGDVKAIVNLTRITTGVYAEVKNNAITDLWEPGSTFKTASMMVGLEDGVITMDETVDVGCGQYMMHGRNMKDHNWRRGGYGRRISVPECLMFSSNIGVSRLIDESYHDCPEKYVDGLYREGVGVPFDLPFAGAGKPHVRRPKPDGSNWSKTALAWMSIGYETQIPPIYTLAFYNGIANNGRMVKPRFVRSVLGGGMVQREFPVEVVREKMCSAQTLKNIQTILKMVVNDPTGLGKKAGCKQFHVSGKTGTAMVAGPHGYGNTYMVSFCGYYPSEAPKYSCIVCIKEQGPSVSGGSQAGPVFRELAQYVMSRDSERMASEAADSLSVFEADIVDGDMDVTSEVLQEIGVNANANASANTNTNDGCVPDLRGMGLRDAVRMVEQLGMKVVVHGQGTVSSQSIPPGTIATTGSQIVLQLKH